ncbi:MAG: YdeI/OmpD-associated family protein [Acidobacteriota bacterium]|nr:YdeI/OmpD-associated family protein [Gemmatimonadota bacterium]MDH3524703.1 YdeI/OmpD-associated family protein [Acidobacteriota bacterium]
MERHESVDEFLATRTEWKEELVALRSILRSTGLEETVKWGAPVYTFEGKNVVGLGAFKSYFGLWFFQGALLADERKVLINAQEGRTKALRQLRLRSMDEIDRELIRAYVAEAIDLVERGVEIKPGRKKPWTMPAELRAALREHREARASFEALTPGRQREYVEYVASAKRHDTRARRIDKILPMIASGVGLNDRYRSG